MRKVTSKLSVIITKKEKKMEIEKELEKYCGVSSRHICVSCKTKVEKIAEKVEEIRPQWEKTREACIVARWHQRRDENSTGKF